MQVAKQLQPDLILLDIGLPTLNGVAAARRILEASPTSKIVFVSENRSLDIAEEALRTGAAGYVVKSSAASELLPAVTAVLQGRQFLSGSLTGPALADTANKHTEPLRRQNVDHHEVRFYLDETALVDDFAHFLESAVQIGDAVVVIATESHRVDILRRLEAVGLDIATAEQTRYIPLQQAVRAAAERGLHIAVG